MTLLNNDVNFDFFKEYYLSQSMNLKFVMCLLNHSCIRIKYKAIQILHYFFIDLESRDKQIQSILIANKDNFEKYFNKFDDSTTDSDIIEKKTYILYELERLLNMS